MGKKASLWQRLRRWYDGEYKVHDDPYIIGIFRERSPWADRLEALFGFLRAHYWNLIFLAIGLAGLWLAWLALS